MPKKAQTPPKMPRLRGEMRDGCEAFFASKGMPLADPDNLYCVAAAVIRYMGVGGPPLAASPNLARKIVERFYTAKVNPAPAAPVGQVTLGYARPTDVLNPPKKRRKKRKVTVTVKDRSTRPSHLDRRFGQLMDDDRA